MNAEQLIPWTATFISSELKTSFISYLDRTWLNRDIVTLFITFFSTGSIIGGAVGGAVGGAIVITVALIIIIMILTKQRAKQWHPE